MQSNLVNETHENERVIKKEFGKKTLKRIILFLNCYLFITY